MAIVFISPKHRQKMFFMGITVVFLMFLAVVFLGVFLTKPTEVPVALVFNKPKVNIDMKVFGSDQFKSLEPFSEMQTQYSYRAVDKSSQVKTGFIPAVSTDQARSILTNMGLTVTELKEAEVGRDNPFSPYNIQISK